MMVTVGMQGKQKQQCHRHVRNARLREKFVREEYSDDGNGVIRTVEKTLECDDNTSGIGSR